MSVIKEIHEHLDYSHLGIQNQSWNWPLVWTRCHKIPPIHFWKKNQGRAFSLGEGLAGNNYSTLHTCPGWSNLNCKHTFNGGFDVFFIYMKYLVNVASNLCVKKNKRTILNHLYAWHLSRSRNSGTGLYEKHVHIDKEITPIWHHFRFHPFWLRAD